MSKTIFHSKKFFSLQNYIQRLNGKKLSSTKTVIWRMHESNKWDVHQMCSGFGTKTKEQFGKNQKTKLVFIDKAKWKRGRKENGDDFCRESRDRLDVIAKWFNVHVIWSLKRGRWVAVSGSLHRTQWTSTTSSPPLASTKQSNSYFVIQ